MIDTGYQFLEELFLRTPYYSYLLYDLGRLPEVLKEEAFLNALWLASPEFYRVLQAKGFGFDRLTEKEKLSLSKYYNRMCFRPVPFGSFASFTLTCWGNNDSIILKPDTAWLHIIPDQGLLTGLYINHKTALKDIPLIKNPTLYRLGKEFRYIKSVVDENGKYFFSLEAVVAEQFYINLFGCFKKRAVLGSEVISRSVRQTGCSEAEASGHLEFMINEQVLIAYSRGAMIGTNAPVMALLSAGIQTVVSKIRSGPLDQYGLLARRAEELDALFRAKGEDGRKQYFYGALERFPVQAGLGAQLQEELFTALHVLQGLAAPVANRPLKKFIQDFEKKFDQQVVPLLLALDPDAGIPYDNLATGTGDDGLPGNLWFPDTGPEVVTLAWTRTHRFLLKLWTDKGKDNQYRALTICEGDLKELEGDQEIGVPFPNTITMVFRKTEDYLLIEHAGGATATSLIGRFSTFSDEVEALCRKLAALECKANPDVVFADIGQHSDSHVDNINRRAQVYPYEIPLNVFSALDPSSQLSPGDLFVSVRDGELVLQSARLKRRVIPRLATAYNFQNSGLAVFRLLCDLQYQSLNANLTFNLEAFFPGLNFYPRVSYGHIIISPAKWVFTSQDFRCLSEQKPGESPLKKMQAFRELHHLPKYISIGISDQQLVFNLANQQEVLFFIGCVIGKSGATLQEYLLPERSVKSGNKPLAAQFLAFLHNSDKIYSPAAAAGIAVKPQVKRNYLLGSKWIYLKVYCTPLTADRILTQVVSPVLANNRKYVLSWFFVRYEDNSHHIRVRVCLDRGVIGAFLIALETQMKLSGNDALIKDYVGDTYKRELERYGPGLIELAEDLFCSGSNLVLSFLEDKVNGQAGLTSFQLALLTADRMVAGFFENLDAAIRFCGRVVGHFISEFKADKPFRLKLDIGYRSQKEEIEELLGSWQNVSGTHFGQASLMEEVVLKTTTISKAVVHRTELEQQKLLSDLIHMQLNRGFQSNQRKQEFVAYYYLNKFLTSKLARAKKQTSPS